MIFIERRKRLHAFLSLSIGQFLLSRATKRLPVPKNEATRATPWRYACRNAVAPFCVQSARDSEFPLDPSRWIPRIRAASTCEAARRSALMLSVLSIALKFASAGSSTACHHFASPRHGGTTRKHWKVRMCGIGCENTGGREVLPPLSSGLP